MTDPFDIFTAANEAIENIAGVSNDTQANTRVPQSNNADSGDIAKDIADLFDF